MLKFALEVISIGTLRSVVRGGLGFVNEQYSGIMALELSVLGVLCAQLCMCLALCI